MDYAPHPLFAAASCAAICIGGSVIYILGGQWGGHNCSWGGTDLYCHSEPPLTSGKLYFIINFIGGLQEGHNFYWGRPPPLMAAL